MGFFNPIAYFIKCFFRFLRSITGKLFVIFVLLFCVLILYMCIDKGVFAQDTFDLQIPGFNFTYYNIPHITDQFVITVDYYQGQSWILFYDNSVVDFLYDNTTRYNDGGRDSNGNLMTTTAVYRTYNNTSWEQLGNGQNYEDKLVQHIRYNTMPIVYPNGSVYRAADPNPFFVSPYFITTEQDIQNWNFDFLEISGGAVPYYTTSGGTTPIFGNTYLELILTYNYVNYDIDVSQFIIPDYDNNTWSIKIPKNYLFNYVNVQNGIDFKFTLYAEQQYPFEQYSVETNNMTFNLTTEQLAEINNDTNKQIQGTIVQQQQEIVQGQQDLNNSINNDNVDDMSSDFTNLGNGLSAEDNTGIDTIFQKLYDAFCTDSVQSVSLTIPFVNKSFIIDTNGISKNFPEAVKSIVAVFVWGVIGLWVLKDIRTIIDKISEGSPEDVGSDVKKEVL